MAIIELTADDLRPREDPAVTRDKIDAVKEYACHLNGWRRKFLESIDGQNLAGKCLTNKQQAILDGLYDQKLF